MNLEVELEDPPPPPPPPSIYMCTIQAYKIKTDQIKEKKEKIKTTFSFNFYASQKHNFLSMI